MYKEIEKDVEMRLARFQKYDVRVYCKLDHLTCDGREFFIKQLNMYWNIFHHTFSAHRSEQMRIYIVQKTRKQIKGQTLKVKVSCFGLKTYQSYRQYMRTLEDRPRNCVKFTVTQTTRRKTL